MIALWKRRFTGDRQLDTRISYIWRRNAYDSGTGGRWTGLLTEIGKRFELSKVQEFTVESRKTGQQLQGKQLEVKIPDSNRSQRDLISIHRR